MLRYLTVAVLVLFDVFVTGAVNVVSEKDVDPMVINYKNATYVLLKNIKIQEIPKNYFRDLNLDLSLLSITNSRLLRIDEEAFDGLDHLNLLELSDNGITKIEPKTFARLNGLELLQLKSNSLREVSLVLKHVQEIVLARNKIEELQEDFIVGESVTFIDLRWNRLKHLKHSMKHLVKLATIYIGNNEISEIEPEVFADNGNLVRIYATGNRLTSTRGLKLQLLKTLDLSLNRLERLDNESFAGMSFLDELMLNGNKIGELNDPFADAKNLQFLDLSDNLITEIDPSLFRNNMYLSKLKLSKNGISELKPFEKKLRHLRLLDMSHNNLEVIDPKFFESADRLEILDLSFNKLTKIGNLLSPLTSLVTLDMSSNQLQFDRNTTRHNEKLNSLNVSSNGLDLSLSYFDRNSNLKYLDLSRNNITHFCDIEPTIESIASIDLSYNQIKELNCFKNNNLLPFAFIDISHNPFMCDSNFDDVIAHFVLMQSRPFRMQSFNIKDVHSVSHSLGTFLDLWNTVKRELCPNGLDIHIKSDQEDLRSDEREEEESEITYDDNYWGDDYYDTLLTPDDKTVERRESTETPNKDLHFDADLKYDDEIQRIIEQSEQRSWNNINKMGNVVEDNEDELSDILHVDSDQITSSMVIIGIAVITVLANVAIFLFIRLRALKKDFRSVQQYTHLENKVYKDTTIPNDLGAYGGKKPEDNYRINCARMFTNFGFRASENDTESVKKMIVDNGIKADV